MTPNTLFVTLSLLALALPEESYKTQLALQASQATAIVVGSLRGVEDAGWRELTCDTTLSSRFRTKHKKGKLAVSEVLKGPAELQVVQVMWPVYSLMMISGVERTLNPPYYGQAIPEEGDDGIWLLFGLRKPEPGAYFCILVPMDSLLVVLVFQFEVNHG